jgi:hypothetical protein
MKRCHWMLSTMIVIGAAVSSLRADEAERQKRSSPGLTVRAEASATLERFSQLTDFHLASWVILENDAQVRVSRFAEQNAKDKRVKELAGKMVESHTHLMAVLHAHLGIADIPDGDFDFGEALQEVADRLAKTRPSSSRTARENPVDQGSTSDAEEDSEERARRERRTQDANRDLRDRLRNNVLPVLRDNLPAILDVLGEAIEETEAEITGLAFIRLKQQLGEKFAASVIEELKRNNEEDLDQGYLGFQIAAHLRLLDTIEVAKSHASPALAATLDLQLADVGEQLDRVHTLMKEVTQKDGSSQQGE